MFFKKANIRHPGFATSSDAPPPKPKKKSTPLPSWKEKQLESGMDDEFQPMSSEALEAHVANELKQGPQGLDLLGITIIPGSLHSMSAT